MSARSTIRRKCARLNRRQIIALLDKVCVDSHDESSDDDLRELLAAIVEDGDISDEDLDPGLTKTDEIVEEPFDPDVTELHRSILARSQERGYCLVCQASLKTNTHTLCAGVISGLKVIVDRVGDQPVNLVALRLTRNQWDNFQKLKYWGLVCAVPNEHGKTKQGVWRATEKGLRFRHGLIALPRKVATFRGLVVKVSEEMVTIDGIKSRGYKQRDEYAEDAAPLGQIKKMRDH